MTDTITKTESKTDWEVKDLPRTSPSPESLDATQSAVKWTTRWHGKEDEHGVLIERGNVKVALLEDQWAIYVRPRTTRRWKPISYHLHCDSLLRTLRERQASRRNRNPKDFEDIERALSA